ncbi:MAG: hypothetical protein HON14_11425 [Rhodospirillaceae bacterium]|jgi:hypothetical protein|nr:hypothetical protein [Rhodospirillaceae bacterium]MBT4589046.1 hypothetical protein [Rhodospirillaceae bacterium]MBT4939736.1 hypothetical protein [Rhodospirillaceae bacterium]MBT5940935.1 hypothetical protein [Rhodospirillaceae bacterium]MBT7265691.1 hypothetical protein [Rhodospirillaceae bacterium]
MSEAVETSTTSFRQRKWHHRRDARFVLAVAAFIVLFYSWGFINGPDRIDADLTAQIEKSDALVNLVITSKFPAEEFHLGIFQEVGTIRGNKGRDTFLFRVKPKDVRMLARKYWIEKIALAPPMKF